MLEIIVGERTPAVFMLFEMPEVLLGVVCWKGEEVFILVLLEVVRFVLGDENSPILLRFVSVF